MSTEPIEQESLMAYQVEARENADVIKSYDTRRHSAGNNRNRVSLTREVFDGLVVDHLPHLLRLATRLTNTLEDAQDLVQDTMVKAFGAVDQFEPGSNIEAWLITILLNAYRDRVRRAHRRPPLLSTDALEEFVDRQLGKTQLRRQSSWQNRETVGMHTDLVRDTYRAINNLSPKLRRVVQLADVDGHSYKEIAETVGCPIGTVMSRLSRGRDLVRTALEDDADV